MRVMKERRIYLLISYIPTLTMHYQVCNTPICQFEKRNKSNHHPVSVLPNLSKVSEKPMQNQTYPYLKKIFQNNSADSGKASMLSFVLWQRLKKCHSCLDKSSHAAAPPTRPSKAFDCSDHKLLITNLTFMV